jgi:hypothetical protein
VLVTGKGRVSACPGWAGEKVARSHDNPSRPPRE